MAVWPGSGWSEDMGYKREPERPLTSATNAAVTQERRIAKERQMARNDGRDAHQRRRTDGMNIIARLASMNMDRSNLDEMVELLAVAEPVKTKFEALDIPVPEALAEGLKTLKREVQRHADDAVEMRLRELDAQDAADRTSTERRDDRRREREKLLTKRRGESVPTPA